MIEFYGKYNCAYNKNIQNMTETFNISNGLFPGLDERLYDTEFNPTSILTEVDECQDSEFKDEIKLYRFLIYITSVGYCIL